MPFVFPRAVADLCMTLYSLVLSAELLSRVMLTVHYTHLRLWKAVNHEWLNTARRTLTSPEYLMQDDEVCAARMGVAYNPDFNAGMFAWVDECVWTCPFFARHTPSSHDSDVILSHEYINKFALLGLPSQSELLIVHELEFDRNTCPAREVIRLTVELHGSICSLSDLLRDHYPNKSTGAILSAWRPALRIGKHVWIHTDLDVLTARRVRHVASLNDRLVKRPGQYSS